MFYRSSPHLPNRFGVYIHTPYCVHKCSYCDFFSFTSYQESDFRPFTNKLILELTQSASWLSSLGYREPLHSIFIGGGTPSLFPTDEIHRILDTVLEAFPAEDGIEITLEANPETVTEVFSKQLSKTPVNRISLGAQSFQEAHLKTLERLGSGESIVTAINRLKEVGFQRLNLDLIFGIPGQSPDQMVQDIHKTVALGPEHISSYQLTLKPGHPLYDRLPSDETSADLYELAVSTLRQSGFLQYEISNFCRENGESRHNLLYWDGGDYLGVGPSAASRFFSDGKFYHRKSWSDMNRYFSSGTFPDPVFQESSLEQSLLEATFLELRKNVGVDIARFQGRYGFNLTSARNFPLFLKEGLIETDGQRIRLTDRGRLLADRVTRDLVD